MPNRNSMFALYLAKVEVTEGTDPTPDASNNVIELSEIFEPDYDNVFKNDADSRARGATLTPGDPLIPAGKWMSTGKKAFVRGTSGAPSTSNRIECDPWFQAAGYAVTYDNTGGAEKVTYTLADTGLASITEYYYRDGILYKHVGVRGDLNLVMDVGGALTLDFASQGRVSSDADTAVPSSPTFKTTDWPLAVDAPTFTIDGYTAGVIRKCEIKTGNAVGRRDGVKAVGGIQGARISKRNPTFSITLEEDIHATKDWTTLRDNKTPIAFNWSVGGTQYNRIDCTAARAFIRTVKPSNDQGLALVTLEGLLRGVSPIAIAIR